MTAATIDGEPWNGEDIVQGETLNFVKPKGNYDFRRNFYSHRVIDHWNKLPLDVKTAESVNSFKNSYDKLRSENTDN